LDTVFEFFRRMAACEIVRPKRPAVVTANGTSTYFRVTFPKGTLTWVMTIDSQNKIAGLSLRRTAACKIFNITARADVLY